MMVHQHRLTCIEHNIEQTTEKFVVISWPGACCHRQNVFDIGHAVKISQAGAQKLNPQGLSIGSLKLFDRLAALRGLDADPIHLTVRESNHAARALYASLGAFADRFKRWELCFVVDREDFGSFAGPREGAAEKRPANPRYPARSAWKKSKIVDGAETRWLQRFNSSGRAQGV